MADKKVYNFYLSEDLHKELKKHCVDCEVSMSRFVEEAIQEKLNVEVLKDHIDECWGECQ